MTKKNNITITELYKGGARVWAKYVVESRAIPSMIDGLKPSQRFYLYSSLVNSKNTFQKVSAIAGPASAYGFQHGEVSLMGVGQLMGATWCNNLCLVEGRGSFGSRLIQEAGAPRYIYTKIHDNFSKFIKDLELSPEHNDPEHLPPKYYLPVIPLVLLNGVKGIATGFATNILPRSVEDVKNACIEYIKTGDIKKRVPITFPEFNGETVQTDTNKYVNTGVFELHGKTKLIIKEVPYGFDREGYVKILDKLEEDNEIVTYTDCCDENGFEFVVKLKQNHQLTKNKIIKVFRLSKPATENINVIDSEGNLRHYEEAETLIKDFCDYRDGILKERIFTKIEETSNAVELVRFKIHFIKDILNGFIEFKGKKKAVITQELKERYENISDENIEKLLSMNFYNLTIEQIEKLENEFARVFKELEGWKNTNSKKQALRDLEDI